jgi:hypothetical protein
MTGKQFFNAVAGNSIDIIQLLLSILEKTGSPYCVIGGLAVNAHAEPVVSLDLDLVVFSERIDDVIKAAREAGFRIQEFEHSINLLLEGSDLRIQLQTDGRYQPFVTRAERRKVLGYELLVACLNDVLQGKIWAYSDETRRKSKRQKDMSDIMRLVETHPALREKLPEWIRSQIV